MYKAPDINAPRFRVSRHTLTTDEFFSKFRKDHPKYSSYTNKDLIKIIETFHSNLWMGVINNRDGVELPEKIGHIFIGTCKPKKSSNPDRVKSIVYGKQIKHTNFPSDNFLAKIFYTNYIKRYLFENRDLWKIQPVREFKREVAKNYPEKWKMYHIIDNFKFISDLYQKKVTKNYMQEKNTVSNTYNEFEL